MNERGIVLYLCVHQPYRVRSYSVFDTGINHDYFVGTGEATGWDNRAIFEKVANKSYRPMNTLLLKLLKEHPDFRVSLSLSGVFVEQALEWAPDVIKSFQELIATGRVEILAETYYHSLAFFYSRDEFARQVELHRAIIQDTFGVTPTVFRNTELAYNDELAAWADENGFTGIIAEGWDPILEWRSPNHVYQAAHTALPLLLKNYRLSDDIAFRFNETVKRGGASTFFHDADKSLDGEAVLNLFMDYETFGEHQWGESGVFDFFETFVSSWIELPNSTFYTVSDAIAAHKPAGDISMPHTVTWADSTRDLTAWNGNKLQQEALRYIYALEDDILRTNDKKLIDDWRKLQTSDHFYYMYTKGFEDGNVHASFSPYVSPYDAFLYYLNVIRDLRWRLHVHHNTGGVLHG